MLPVASNPFNRRLLTGYGLAFFTAYLWSAMTLATPDFLVGSEWLSAHQADANLVILEVRYHPHRYYSVGHIEGAVQVQRFKDLGDNNAAVLMRFPSQQDFQARLRQWGVNNDSLVLIYDDARTALASRLYFLLELYGFNTQQVKILNGGTLEWTAFESLSQQPVAPQPGTVTLQAANPNLIVEWTQVYDAVVSRRDSQVMLLDARPSEQYSGAQINHAVRGGHIPGAINIVSLAATDAQSQKWLDDTALANLYRNLPKDKTLYVYCHDGFRMTLTYMQLKYLGFKDMRLYNGGWGHWGNALSLPVVQGDMPFDEEFSL